MQLTTKTTENLFGPHRKDASNDISTNSSGKDSMSLFSYIYFPLSECPTGYKPITQPRFSFRRFVSLPGNYGAICFSFNLVACKVKIGRYFEHHVEFLAKLFQSFLIWLKNIFTKVHPCAPLICTFCRVMYSTCFRFEII